MVNKHEKYHASPAPEPPARRQAGSPPHYGLYKACLIFYPDQVFRNSVKLFSPHPPDNSMTLQGASASTFARKNSLRNLLILIASLSAINTHAQTTEINGRILDATNHDPLTMATVVLQGTNYATVTDDEGHFQLSVPPGLYNVEVSYTGYETWVEQEVITSTARPVLLNIELVESIEELIAVQIESEGFKRTDETPLSIRNFSYAEAQRMPGAVLDLSKAIQSYPGVLPKSTFGYNIVFRGGAPSENRYFLDGIPIPSITHFSVQGSSGGPNGLVNIDFIRGVDIYTAGFPASRGNALSGIMEINQREGRIDRFGARITLGATDYGATIEGPMGQRSSYILSARHSFSQYLLKAFNVPVLPTYSDVQYKQTIHFDDKNELNIVALAAYDVYRLNTDAPESDALLYNVGYIPEGDQNQYTIGLNYRHYLEHSWYSVMYSHTGLSNRADKFRNNSGLEADRLLRYDGQNNSDHFRLEQKIFKGKHTFGYGMEAAYQQDVYDVFGFHISQISIDTINGVQEIGVAQAGVYGTYDLHLAGDRFVLHTGLRTDMAGYSAGTSNPLKQLSPRIAMQYRATDKLSINASSGIYYQLPNSVLLAFTDSTLRDGISWIRSPQVAIGADYRNADHYRVSLEVFYKGYDNYPFLLEDSIAFANAIADYVVVGDQPAASIGKGRAYGLEWFIQQKLKRDYWWMVSYTYSVSEFQDKNGEYRPAVWDSRHFISLTAGKTWKSGWQVGGRWRYSSGTPYTPYDSVASSLISNWEVANRGIFDYNQLNTERLAAFHMLDLRVDKRWNFERWQLNIFMDIQNAYGSKVQLLPYLTTVRDVNWDPVVDPDDPTRYELQQINSDTGRRLYTIGMVVDL